MSSMDIDLDAVNPEEEEGLDENKEGVNQPHSGEKSNKCKQCDYASSQPGDLRRHLKRHSGEKSNKCAQRDIAGHLRTCLKTHSEKNKKTNANSVISYLIRQEI